MKGKCKIQLIDDVTKQVMQEVEDENMITNALRNVMNPSPLFFANNGDYKAFVNGNFPIATTTLGGVLLWSEQLPEDVDYIVHDNPLDLVGHAGNAAYSGNNQLRGSYNTTESGATDTGYKHVWDFSTNQANGTIRCVSLTSAWGGKSGMLGTAEDYSIFKPIAMGQNLDGNLSNPYIYNSVLDNTMSTTEIENNEFYSFQRVDNNKAIIGKHRFLCELVKTSTPTAPQIIDEFEVIGANAFVGLSVAPRIYKEGGLILIYHETASKIREIKISISEKSVVFTNNTIIGTPPNDNRLQQAAWYDNGKLYHLNYSSKDILEIDCKTWVSTKLRSGYTPYCSVFKVGNAICFMHYAQGYPATNDKQTSLFYVNGEWFDGNCYMTLTQPHFPHVHMKGMQKPYVKIESNDSSNQRSVFSVVLYAPYIATIDNLSTPITKTASQSMKLIYTLTDV